MSLSGAEIDRAWIKLGMKIKNKKDRLALFYVGGRLILRTKRSHGSGKVEGNIPHFIRQQMKLNEVQFQELIACPLDRAGYIRILTDKRII